MRRLLLSGLGALLLSACAVPHRPAPPSPLRQAENLYQAGQYRQAALLYESQAGNLPPAESLRARLYAAEAWYRAGETAHARRLLATIEPARLPAEEQLDYAFLSARLALAAERPELALRHLERIDPRRLPPIRQRQLHELKARAYALTGDLAGQVRERVVLARFLRDPRSVSDNNAAILEALLHLPEESLQALAQSGDRELAGWVELARILRRYPNRSPALDAAVAEWRSRHPYHPADRHRFLERYLTTLAPPLQRPEKIAALLPTSGPYRQAGEAVLAGIEALRRQPTAWEADFVLYDSESGDPVTLYRQAAEQGAQMVLGPLLKPKLERLAALAGFNPPVLALNRLAQTARPGLYQLALAPEESIEQVAASAWMHDHRRALALLPDTPTGERIGGHFAATWENLGGRLLETARYDPAQADHTAAIEKVLNIDESKRRYRRLRKVVWEVKFQPRVRRDADFIFLQADPGQGRLIRPQLRFHRAEHLPVYATRDIYQGHPDPQRDQDLDGIRFCDIPWLLGGDVGNLPTVDAFEAEHGLHSGGWLRLAALGMDAWQLPFTLLVDQQPVQGATGLLSLGPEGRIRRRLTCAEFRHGVPEVYGLAPEALTDAAPRPQ
ncbi:conserved hypothetical protein [Methylomarinovum caldicuralii]|uniref:Penicillin-binding protein activator n=1 Tax=Methylomarinovum caldicuralii TaxID=438856 RepID=A0AAU9CAE8_9GAMM|nr:penicillin-binding protein activator [Methylomarinovum caldicuralii]BCX82581.1 conserved hypothetical protein [Methylomarinovum caldicuralii]